MRVLKTGVYLALCVMVLGMCTGCRGARFIHAKAKVLSGIGNRDQLISLLTSNNLTAPEQSKADELRQDAVVFQAAREKDLEIYGDLNGPFTLHMLAVSQPSVISTFPLPVEIAVLTSGRQSPGETTRSGYAEMRFGSEGPVYTTDGGDGFFEFEVSAVYEDKGDKVASGTFTFIAHNKDDENDARRLCVMDGAYIARIK